MAEAIVYVNNDVTTPVNSMESYMNAIVIQRTVFQAYQYKLEQLQRLRSEDTPAASWLPIPLNHIGSQVKWRQR